jgi:hypothetical protein
MAVTYIGVGENEMGTAEFAEDAEDCQNSLFVSFIF